MLKVEGFKKYILIGFFSIFCFLATFILRIRIGSSMIHMGNAVCLVISLLFGGVIGGASGSLGMAIFDLTGGIYIINAPFTAMTKFLMGFCCGKVAELNKNTNVDKFNLIGVFAGVILNFGGSITTNFIIHYFIYKFSYETTCVQIMSKMYIWIVNGVVSAIVALILYKTLVKSSKSRYFV